MHEALKITTEDCETLQDLGRACAEIVHDTRNELNALKLYATFLLKRSEKNKWLPDERETLAKLFAGLERSAGALAMLVHYSRPIEPVKRSGIDVRQMVKRMPVAPGLGATVTGDLKQNLIVECDSGDFVGEFDPVLLTEALMAITLSVLELRSQKGDRVPLKVRLRREESELLKVAVIDWECVGFKTVEVLDSVGLSGVRVSLAIRIVAAHQGTIERHEDSLRARLPLSYEQSQDADLAARIGSKMQSSNQEEL